MRSFAVRRINTDGVDTKSLHEGRVDLALFRIVKGIYCTLDLDRVSNTCQALSDLLNLSCDSYRRVSSNIKLLPWRTIVQLRTDCVYWRNGHGLSYVQSSEKGQEQRRSVGLSSRSSRGSWANSDDDSEEHYGRHYCYWRCGGAPGS